jgi:hypothetical protein
MRRDRPWVVACGTQRCVRLGRGRGEAIRNIYYSDRQLPPGHDPGANSGGAPNGRQRGSRPLDILVECRDHLRPRRDSHQDEIIARVAPEESRTPLWRAGRVLLVTAGSACTARPAGCARGGHGDHGAGRAHRDDVTSGEGRSSHCRHGGHGGHGPRAITAAAVGPCPPCGRINREGSRRSRPARRSREERPPWPPCGAARTGPSKTIPAITAITAITPVTAVTARSRR